MALNLKHFLVLSLGFSAAAWASPHFTTRQLDGKDYADMQDIVHKQTKRCYAIDKSAAPHQTDATDDELDSSGVKQIPEVRECLKGIVALVLARREQNDPVQRDLLKKTIFEIQENYRIQILKEITQETIDKYKRNQDNKDIQATAYEQLKNLLAEANSRFKGDNEEVKEIIVMIQKADLEVDSKLTSFRANGPSGVTPNLSDRAKEILKSHGKVAEL